MKIFDCIYGASGSGKSEACARVIEQLYKTTGQTARVVLGDGSTSTYDYLQDAGVAALCEFTAMDWPQDVIMKLTDGWWPNAQGVLVAPGTAGNDLTRVGIYVFEGLSVAARYVMSGNVEGSLARRAAQGEKIGQDAPYRIVEGKVDPKTGRILEGPGTSFAANSPTHYGVVQNLMNNAILTSKRLPVEVVLWTAHEAQNDPEKDLSRELVIGPEIIGKAMTNNVQKHFQNTLHCCTVAKRVKQQDAFTGRAVDELDSEYRLYTRDHFSATGTSMTRYKALTRKVNTTQFPQYLVSDTPGLTLVAYYAKLDELRKAAGASLMQASTAAHAEEAAPTM